MTDDKNQFSIHIIANTALGPSMSGGDKIFIEFARYWAKIGCSVHVYVWEEGLEMCKRNNLENVHYVIWSAQKYKITGFLGLYLIRTIKGIFEVQKITDRSQKIIVYSASDFFPDLFPAFFLRMRLERSKWIGSLYLFAPNPVYRKKDILYRGGKTSLNLNNILYFFTQQISCFFLSRYADRILVANQLDKNVFLSQNVPENNVIPIYGGVDLRGIQKIPACDTISFEGCFVGRFHPQKGPLELIRIWEAVCKEKPDAKLCIIGDGPLKDEMLKQIHAKNLQKRIVFAGYVDGEEKYRILKRSRVFLHTPVQDTGGMAAAEGMACGLPVVGFDLPGYQYCYPHGMLKAPKGDIEQFAKLVLKLLDDQILYEKIRTEALDFTREWDWECRAEMILQEMHSITT